MADSDEEQHPMNDDTMRSMMVRIEPNFANQLDGVKYALYEKVVFTPDEETKEAQDNALLNNYIRQLNSLYHLSIDAQEGNERWNLDPFPEELRNTIRSVLQFICEYFKKNSVAKRIPYEHYLRSNLITNEFQQHMYRKYTSDSTDGDDAEGNAEEYL